MEYTLKNITTQQELDAALSFETRLFGTPSERHSPAYARDKWLERMKSHSDLMLYAEANHEIVGIVFGRIEGNDSITVGPVAVDSRFRKLGIARALMLLLEERALKHSIHHLSLGAVETAEGFYERLGYTGMLLIQSEKHTVDELLSLNTKYSVIKTNVHDGTVSQVFLMLPIADREFQREYERSFSDCYTQMVYSKEI